MKRGKRLCSVEKSNVLEVGCGWKLCPAVCHRACCTANWLASCCCCGGEEQHAGGGPLHVSNMCHPCVFWLVSLAGGRISQLGVPGFLPLCRSASCGKGVATCNPHLPACNLTCTAFACHSAILQVSQLWKDVVIRVSKDYPEVELSHM